MKHISLTSKPVLSIVLTTIVISALSACSTRDVPVTQHDGPVVGDEVVHAPTTSPVTIDALKKVNTTELAARVKTNTPQAADQDLHTLAPIVLNAAYVENARLNTGSKELRVALTSFNVALIDLFEKKPDMARPWLEKYRTVVESGCDGELKGCIHLRRDMPLFRSDGGSAKVMQLLARETDRELQALPKCAVTSLSRDPSTKPSIASEKCFHDRSDLLRIYFRRLAMAFELKNQTPDTEFSFMYLGRASDYTESLRLENSEYKAMPYTPEGARRITRINEIATRHSEIFEIILNHFNPDLKNAEMRKKFEGFVTDFAPWTYSRKENNPFGQAATRMLTLAAQNFLYKDVSGALNESLAASISESQQDLKEQALKDELKKDLESSFASVSKNLKTTEPKIWKNLSLSDEFPRDEYFFMVDRVFGDHLTPDDASEIWRGSRHDSNKLLSVAENYLKIEIASQIVRTNQYMSGIYANKDWSSATLFQKAVQKSYPLSVQWNQLLGKIDRVQLFIDRNLKVAEGEFASAELRSMSLMLSSIRRNIKYLSVYPNMMLMAYFMSEVDFKIEVYSYFGKVDIDSATIITWFFDGQLGPLFNFGNDGESLRRIETLYAFLFALKTNTFEAFSVNKQPISAVKFFEVVIGKFLKPDRVALEEALTSIRKDTKQSDKLSTFLKICRDDRAAIDAQGNLGPKASPITVELNDITQSTYIGSSSGWSWEAHRFYGSSLNKQVKDINSGLRARLNFVNVMIALFEEHYRKLGTDKSTLDEMISQIKANLSQIQGLQAEYLTEVINAHAQIGPCLDQSIPIEIARQDAILKLEADHLGSVWRAMNASRNGDATALALANKELIASLGLTDIPKGAAYQPLSRIANDSYVYGELDIILRFRQHFKKVAPSVDIIMPSDLTDTSWFKSRRQVAIPFYDDQKDFVRHGMRNFSDSGNSYINYFSQLSDAEIFKTRIELLAELYKLGKISIYDTASEKCANIENITTCPLVSYEVTPERLVNEMTRAIKTLSLSDEKKNPKPEIEILNLLGSSGRWNRDKLKEFMLDKNGDPITLYETLYKMLTSDETLMEEAREFQTTDRSVGHFLFSPEVEFTKILRDGFTPFVRQYFAKVRKLEEAIGLKEKKDAEAGRVLDFSYEIRRGELLRTKVEMTGNRPTYLSRQKIEDFVTKQDLFHRETNGFFNQTN